MEGFVDAPTADGIYQRIVPSQAIGVFCSNPRGRVGVGTVEYHEDRARIEDPSNFTGPVDTRNYFLFWIQEMRRKWKARGRRCTGEDVERRLIVDDVEPLALTTMVGQVFADARRLVPVCRVRKRDAMVYGVGGSHQATDGVCDDADGENAHDDRAAQTDVRQRDDRPRANHTRGRHDGDELIPEQLAYCKRSDETGDSPGRQPREELALLRIGPSEQERHRQHEDAHGEKRFELFAQRAEKRIVRWRWCVRSPNEHPEIRVEVERSLAREIVRHESSDYRHGESGGGEQHSARV
jgi:hypothetical protein